VRGERFAKGQEWNAKNDALESMFSFHNVPKNATVVDVGGGRGQNSLRLLRKFDHLKFIVQDDPSVVDSLKSNPLAMTEAEKSRIRWQGHNFFSAQPVKGAEIYLVNNVFEEMSDE
jgi:16S rRNA A1518/A1519 N6-dimethyltransferase RsmA/KsgA/DIM1 with predicted DNA glycosylase/AP lyase activity